MTRGTALTRVIIKVTRSVPVKAREDGDEDEIENMACCLATRIILIWRRTSVAVLVAVEIVDVISV
ncbi:hypothetical protein TYRP_016450 [Tyrophagus putrescentiae]|nr:hypothetical protein TYRP_016450 [Tyrophagus putrescentiae]